MTHIPPAYRDRMLLKAASKPAKMKNTRHPTKRERRVFCFAKARENETKTQEKTRTERMLSFGF